MLGKTETQLKEQHLTDLSSDLIHSAFDEDITQVRYQLETMKLLVSHLKPEGMAINYAQDLKEMALKLQEPIYKKDWAVVTHQLALYSHLLDSIDMLLAEYDEPNKTP